MKRIVTVMTCLLLSVMLAGCGQYEYKKGVSALENEKYEDAVSRFEKAIEKEVSVGDSYFGIGLVKWEQEDYEGTVEVLEKALEEGAEESAVIYDMLGACKMKLSDPAGAIGYYEKALAFKDCTDEMRKEISFNIIAACEDIGDYESARTCLAEYVAQYPEDEQAVKEAEFLETR